MLWAVATIVAVVIVAVLVSLAVSRRRNRRTPLGPLAQRLQAETRGIAAEEVQ